MMILEMLGWLALGLALGGIQHFFWPGSMGRRTVLAGGAGAFVGGTVIRVLANQSPDRFSAESLIGAGVCAFVVLGAFALWRGFRPKVDLDF